MKKILINLIIAILIITGCITTSLANTETTTSPKVELRLPDEIEISPEIDTLSLKLTFGSVEGLEDGALVSFLGTFEYDSSVFSEATVTGLNGYSVTYVEETKRIILDPKEPVADAEIAEIKLKLVEGLGETSTSVLLALEEFTDGTNEFQFPTKEVQIAIKEAGTSENPDTEGTTESTGTESTQEPVTEPTQTTEQTTESTNDTEFTIIDDVTSGTEQGTESSTQKTTSDTTTAKEEIPKTGSTEIKLIFLAIVIVGVVSIAKFRKIEIE